MITFCLFICLFVNFPYNLTLLQYCNDLIVMQIKLVVVYYVVIITIIIIIIIITILYSYSSTSITVHHCGKKLACSQ